MCPTRYFNTVYDPVMLHDREFRESKTVQDARSSFVQGKLFLIQSVKNDVAFI